MRTFFSKSFPLLFPPSRGKNNLSSFPRLADGWPWHCSSRLGCCTKQDRFIDLTFFFVVCSSTTDFFFDTFIANSIRFFSFFLTDQFHPSILKTCFPPPPPPPSRASPLVLFFGLRPSPLRDPVCIFDSFLAFPGPFQWFGRSSGPRSLAFRDKVRPFLAFASANGPTNPQKLW